MPYFDHNATTPIAPCAREAWLRASEESWQNPSSPYRDAARVRVRMDTARDDLAQLLGCSAGQVVFNSGATEGANAVFAHWAGALPSGLKVAVNPTEHPCVVEAARHYLAPEQLVWLEIDAHGVVRLPKLEALLAGGAVAAVSLMAANNETGVLQPWREVAALCRRRRVAYHCDASQWLGKLPASGLGEAGWVTASAHKFGGPKGTGVLLWPAQSEGFRSQRGGEQEHGHRAGTEDYPGIAAMVAALVEAESSKVMKAPERLRLRDAFEVRIQDTLPGIRIVGAGADRLWNTVSLIMPSAENHRWVAKLDKRGFQVSTGSACATGEDGPSPVLAAMGFSPEEARRAIRVSAGWETVEEDWRGLAAALAEVDVELRSSSAPGSE